MERFLERLPLKECEVSGSPAGPCLVFFDTWTEKPNKERVISSFCCRILMVVGV